MAKEEKTYKGTKRDQYTIVLEGIRSDFRAFGEGLQILDQKMERGFSELRSEMSIMKTDILVLRSDMSDVKKLLHKHNHSLEDHEERITALE